ncbi:MAG: hypothetical protein P1U89_17950 [Verrucomicrobiales bacterium]|nr:hypothetical protein [Verrucomicrobiales bacterium]
MMNDIFKYSIDFGDQREFLITVYEDGSSEWFDRRSYLENGQNSTNLRMMRILGNDKAAEQIETMESEFKIRAQIPPDVFELVELASKQFADDNWTIDNEASLDPHLKGVFWKEVSPHLDSPPSKKG